jgi:transcriptional activator of cad operon
MTIKPDSHLQVGEWQYIPEQDKLVQFDANGKIVLTADLDNLSQKVANYFIVKAGKLVTKDELLQDVWGIRDVSDGRVTRVIRVLRVALGDDTREPRYIETIPKRGYRFIAPVSEVVAEPQLDFDLAPQNDTVETPFFTAKIQLLLAFILISVFSLGWIFWPEGSVDTAESTVPMLRYKPLTSLDGLEFYQNMSNDERYLVYSHTNKESDSNTVLMLEDLVENKRIQLTDNKFGNLGAAFNPDGSAIAYQRLKLGSVCEIRLMTLDLQQFKVVSDEILAKCGANSLSSRMSWSPDGRYLVFPEMRDGEKQMTLTLLSLKTGSKEKLTVPPISSFGDYSARFSKAGDKVVFLRDAAGTAQIWILELETRASRLLTKVNDTYPGNVDWAPDDESIVYPSSASTVSTVSLDGKVRLLAYTNISANELQVTSTGSIVASIGYFSHVNPRRVSNPLANTKYTNELIFNSNRNEIFVEASPVLGGPLAVVSKRSGLNQVWLLFHDDSQQQLTNFSDPERIRGLVFSPDGTRLLVHLTQRLLMYDFDGSYKEIRAATDASIGVPSWSRDGKFIFYPEMKQGKWQLIKIGTEDLHVKNILQQEREFYLESYEGNYSFWRDGNSKRFYMQVNGFEPELLDFVLPDTQIQTHYHLTQNGVYFSKLIGELSYRLYFYDIATKSVKTVLEEINLGRFSVSADEKYIYILEYEFADIDIGILEGVVENL